MVTCDKKVASDNFYVHGLIGLSRMAELVASLCRNGQRRRRLVKRESVGSNSFCITVLMIVVRLVVLICGTHDNAAQAASFNLEGSVRSRSREDAACACHATSLKPD